MTALLQKYPRLDCCIEDIEKAYVLLNGCYQWKGMVMTCGNGGSAADSEHMVGELMKGFRLKRPLPDSETARMRKLFTEDGDYIGQHLQGALPSISLASNIPLITALANDVAADMVYAQQVYGYGKRGDVLICFSTSGNSMNIIRAIQVAKSMDIDVIGFTGGDGGRMKEICDVTIIVPESSTPEIQELHLPVYHAICMQLEEDFFNSHGKD